MKYLVTGGAGFIGSAVIRYLIKETEHSVINLDKLTYAGNLESLSEVSSSPRYKFVKADICEHDSIRQILSEHKPNIIMHLAAESHVDRSIDGPTAFIQTNIVGTYTLLEACRSYWNEQSDSIKQGFRFLHVSTDEVYGSLGETDYFTEQSAYSPNSPYSASKAASDHLVRAWHRTYGLPTLISNCSNNYGPYQFPEKLIPVIILNALDGKPLPIYGNGLQVRDWLYVEDHADALYQVATRGQIGDTYNIGGNNERTNLQVVNTICEILDELAPDHPGDIIKYSELVKFVVDRPGHDKRYAIDASKIKNDLGWYPKESFETGLRKTIKWYLEHETWLKHVLDGSYQRLGLGQKT